MRLLGTRRLPPPRLYGSSVQYADEAAARALSRHSSPRVRVISAWRRACNLSSTWLVEWSAMSARATLLLLACLATAPAADATSLGGMHTHAPPVQQDDWASHSARVSSTKEPEFDCGEHSVEGHGGRPMKRQHSLHLPVVDIVHDPHHHCTCVYTIYGLHVDGYFLSFVLFKIF